MTQNPIADYVAEHPKVAGALFMLCLLLSQASSVAAQMQTSQPGP